MKGIHPKVGREFQSPFLSIEDIQSLLASMTDQIDDKLKSVQDEYEGFLTDDPIREWLNEITYDRIGKRFSQLDLKKIYDDGLRSYDLHQPPGYLDANKPGVKKYGDLIIWRQLINRAKETSENIYFISDDAKSDWWQKNREGPDGARHELIEEMEEYTSRRFLISKGGDFYAWAGDHIGRRAREGAIAEARRSTARTDLYRDVLSTAMRDAVGFLDSLPSANDIVSQVAQISSSLVDGGRYARRQMEALNAAWEELRGSAVADSFLRFIDGCIPGNVLPDEDPQDDQAPEGED